MKNVNAALIVGLAGLMSATNTYAQNPIHGSVDSGYDNLKGLVQTVQNVPIFVDGDVPADVAQSAVPEVTFAIASYNNLPGGIEGYVSRVVLHNGETYDCNGSVASACFDPNDLSVHIAAQTRDVPWATHHEIRHAYVESGEVVAVASEKAAYLGDKFEEGCNQGNILGNLVAPTCYAASGPKENDAESAAIAKLLATNRLGYATDLVLNNLSDPQRIEELEPFCLAMADKFTALHTDGYLTKTEETIATRRLTQACSSDKVKTKRVSNSSPLLKMLMQ